MSNKVLENISSGKPPNAGAGRPKGSLNKATKEIKELIINALDKAGGVDYLVRQADENPSAFMSLVGKVLPLQVNGAGANGEHLIDGSISVKFIPAKK
jgi:hypothetical protein